MQTVPLLVGRGPLPHPKPQVPLPTSRSWLRHCLPYGITRCYLPPYIGEYVLPELQPGWSLIDLHALKGGKTELTLFSDCTLGLEFEVNEVCEALFCDSKTNSELSHKLGLDLLEGKGRDFVLCLPIAVPSLHEVTLHIHIQPFQTVFFCCMEHNMVHCLHLCKFYDHRSLCKFVVMFVAGIEGNENL